MGMGGEMFPDLWEGLFLKGLGKQVQQCTANERHIGQQIGVTGSGTILAHQGIAPPVIADFNSTPVSSDQPQPLLGAIVLRGQTREIMT